MAWVHELARHRPAGLLVAHDGVRVMIDGGPGTEPRGALDAWRVTDEQGELMSRIRGLAAARGLALYAGSFRKPGLLCEAKRVIHTSHPAYGYRIRAAGSTIVWGLEFYRFPAWASLRMLLFSFNRAGRGLSRPPPCRAASRQAPLTGVDRETPDRS